jgi:dihydrofolate reductase (trimethoprim resistance protein)
MNMHERLSQYRSHTFDSRALLSLCRAYRYALSRKSRFDDVMLEFPYGTLVHKIKGAEWTGHVVGYYSTTLNPKGVAVESKSHPGSVQIYPASALMKGYRYGL